MRKIVSFTMILVLSFAMLFVYPAKQASANPLAVGGALYLGGAGVYVLGAVAVGGLAGLAGCVSCQEDIEAHAARTWDGTTQLAKDGLQLMIDGSVGAWGATSSALTATDSQFNTWMDKQMSGFAQTYINSKYYGSVGMSPTGITSESKYFSGSQIFIAGQNDSKKRFIVNGSHVTSYEFRGYSNSLTMTVYTGSAFQTLTPVLPATMTFSQFQSRMAATSNNLDAMASVMALAGINVIVGNEEIYQSYQAAVSSFTEPWTDMKDAGLVLPTDNARPMAGDIPLTYDPVTDTYAGIDGITVPHDDVTGFEYQKPHWKTLEDLAMLGLTGAGAGLYIDGWTGSDSVTSTYNPTTDSTTTTTDTTTTHTNVNTGETVTSTTSTTTTTTGDTTGNPTTGEPPPPTGATPTNPFKGKVPAASLLGLWELLVALIWYLIRLITFVSTLALIAPTEIDNPYFQWFTTVQILGITPYPLVQNLALFFLGFSIYKSVRRVF